MCDWTCDTKVKFQNPKPKFQSFMVSTWNLVLGIWNFSLKV